MELIKCASLVRISVSVAPESAIGWGGGGDVAIAHAYGALVKLLTTPCSLHALAAPTRQARPTTPLTVIADVA